MRISKLPVTMNSAKHWLVFCSLIALGSCAKILGVFPMPAYSHFTLGNRLLKELAVRGHEVTMISSFEQNPPVKNYRDIVLPEFRVTHEQKTKSMFDMEKMSPLEALTQMNNFTLEATEKVLSHPKVQELLKSNEKFDLVIIEQFMNEAHRGFQYHYGAPCVILSTIGSTIWTNRLVGNPAPPAYVPEFITGYTSNMSMSQRAFNLIVRIFNELMTHLYNFPKQEAILHQYFPSAPPLSQIMYNTSLVLLNSHPSTNAPVPHTPNMVEIGGYHVNPPKKLPDDLQEFLDEAKDGAIYFSMGSNLKSKDMPKEKREAIISVFKGVKERILWKFEEDLPEKPSHVKIGKWLPQQDILGKIKLKL